MAQEKSLEGRPVRGMHLNIEPGGQLLIEFRGRDERVKSTLVGMETNEYLVIRIPEFAQVKSKLIEGNYVVVRYVSLGCVHGFRARIMGYTQLPVPVAFLSYPQAIETINLRKKLRVACYIPAIAVAEQHELKGVITNISSEGCRFKFKIAANDSAPVLRVDTPLVLSFPLLGNEGVHSCGGEVRNVQRANQKISMGIRFDDVHPEIVEKIEDYVRTMPEYSDEFPPSAFAAE